MSETIAPEQVTPSSDVDGSIMKDIAICTHVNAWENMYEKCRVFFAGTIYGDDPLKIICPITMTEETILSLLTMGVYAQPLHLKYAIVNDPKFIIRLEYRSGTYHVTCHDSETSQDYLIYSSHLEEAERVRFGIQILQEDLGFAGTRM